MPRNMMSFFTQRAGLYITAAVFLFVLVVSAVLMSVAQDAHALRMTMKRVIFEGAKRTEILSIVNNTAKEQVFRLGWRVMRMTEDGSLGYVEEGESMEGLMLAQDMIRYSPRRVVLSPGSSQQIRLMLRRPKDLAKGEYRSHFWIQPEEEAVKFTPDDSAPKPKSPKVKITMLTGMTLPVFIRNGDLSVSVSITDAKVVSDAGRTKVAMTLNREGGRSTYGSMQFYCAGSDEMLHEVKGIAVYTEVTKRRVAFKVPSPEKGGVAACSQVRIKYVAEGNDSQFKGAVMAEAVTGG